QALIDAHEEAIDYINDNPDEAIDLTIEGIDEVTGEKLERSILESAWERTDFTADFEADVIQDFVDASHDLKFLKEQHDCSELVDKEFLERWMESNGELRSLNLFFCYWEFLYLSYSLT